MTRFTTSPNPFGHAPNPNDYELDPITNQWVKKPEAMRIVGSFPPEEPIVAMITFNGKVLIATKFRIFESVGDKLIQLKFEEQEPQKENDERPEPTAG